MGICIGDSYSETVIITLIKPLSRVEFELSKVATLCLLCCLVFVYNKPVIVRQLCFTLAANVSVYVEV